MFNPANAWVPQESILGPILFSLYVNDISNTIRALHADDTAILSTSHHSFNLNKFIQKYIDILEK